METSGGRANRAIKDLLYESSYTFEFFQAVRLLSILFPQKASVGYAERPQEEAVRFTAHVSTSFPPSSIHEITASTKGPDTLSTEFFSLVGAQGVLPLYYTEMVMARSLKKDHATAAFFDLFHHRLVSLFYRAWEKHHFPVQYEREHSQFLPIEQTLTRYLFDLIGLGTEGLRDRLSGTDRPALDFADQSLLLYAGLLAQQPHSAIALRGILISHFALPVEIEQFQGKWFELEDDIRSYLAPDTERNSLGAGAVAGDAVWNPQARFRIRLGPLPYRKFEAFLPEPFGDSPALFRLKQLTAFFAGPALDFDIQLVLLSSEVPRCLADVGDGPGIRLGLNSWLDRRGFTQDADDVVLEGALLAV